jgi:hypothetical protein
MIDLQLALQPQTEQRLKKILSQVQDKEAFALNIIAYQVSELKKGILNLRLELDDFERKYNMTSAKFYKGFLDGILEDEVDFMTWAGLYEMLCQNQVQLSELR